jgi:hypothetical protein
MPIGTVAPPGGVVPVSGGGDPIPPQFGPPGLGDPGLMVGPPGMGLGGPQYPGPGPYGGQPWEDAFPRDGGIHQRIARRWWADADFTLWFVPRQGVLGPLVTSGPPVGNGVLGRVGTTVLSGTESLGYGALSGFNIHTGAFLDADRRFGFEIGGFLTELKANDDRFASDATGQPLLARPYLNAATGLQDALLVSFPTFAAGRVDVVTTTRSYGAEASAVTSLFRSCPDGTRSFLGCLWDVTALAGFRYLSVEEELRVEQFTNVLPGNSVPFDGKSYLGPVAIEVSDRFRTANRFYGGQVGLKSSIYNGRWSLHTMGKVAAGVMHQEVTVNGFSTLTGGGTRSVVPGGLYANSTNIGRYDNDEFTWIPEVSARLGFAWTTWLSTHVGYNFLYIDRVARPGDQYTNRVNPATVPTSFSYGLGGPVPVPNPAGTQTDFWLQGVSFGVTVKY